jgi:hypothetical protein
MMLSTMLLLRVTPTTIQFCAVVRIKDYGLKCSLQFIYRAVLSKIDYQRCLTMSDFFGYLCCHLL